MNACGWGVHVLPAHLIIDDIESVFNNSVFANVFKNMNLSSLKQRHSELFLQKLGKQKKLD